MLRKRKKKKIHVARVERSSCCETSIFQRLDVSLTKSHKRKGTLKITLRMIKLLFFSFFFSITKDTHTTDLRSDKTRTMQPMPALSVTAACHLRSDALK